MLVWLLDLIRAVPGRLVSHWRRLRSHRIGFHALGRLAPFEVLAEGGGTALFAVGSVGRHGGSAALSLNILVGYSSPPPGVARKMPE